MEQRFINNDGWNEEDFNDTCMPEFLDNANKLNYEIKNCRRGAYTNAETVDELINYLETMLSQLNDTINELENTRE
jgi:hypothetical protein